MAEVRGNARGRVIEIAARIGPFNVVTNRDRGLRIQWSLRSIDGLQFMKYGVPIMIPIQKHNIRQAEVRQNVKARSAVKGHHITKAISQPAHIETGFGVHKIYPCMGPLGPCGEMPGMSPGVNADLHHPLCRNGIEDRFDDMGPELKHWYSP